MYHISSPWTWLTQITALRYISFVSKRTWQHSELVLSFQFQKPFTCAWKSLKYYLKIVMSVFTIAPWQRTYRNSVSICCELSMLLWAFFLGFPLKCFLSSSKKSSYISDSFKMAKKWSFLVPVPLKCNNWILRRYRICMSTESHHAITSSISTWNTFTMTVS